MHICAHETLSTPTGLYGLQVSMSVAIKMLPLLANTEMRNNPRFMPGDNGVLRL